MLTRDDVFGTTAGWEWHHSGLVVDDIDRAIAFYSTCFDYQVDFLVRGMDDQFQRTIGIADISCDLVQMRSPVSATTLELIRVYDVPAGLDPRTPVHVGVGHSAFIVNDVEEAVAAVVRGGGALMGEIVDFAEGPAAYCWTPSGSVVELEGRHDA